MHTKFYFFIICNLVICSLVNYNLQSQSYSDITYNTGTLIDIGSGADICADAININGTWSGTGTICQGALPVSISVFSSSVTKRVVTLNWVTEWELNNKGFEIERTFIKADGNPGEWIKAAFISGKGTSNTASGYIYKEEIQNTGSYKYRLKQIDYSGSYEYFELQGDVAIAPPMDFELGQNYPNPGNPNTKINFALPEDGKVTIRLYDILGKEVLTIIDEYKKADYYTLDIDGSKLSSGAYFYRIIVTGSSRNFSKTLKMILVK